MSKGIASGGSNIDGNVVGDVVISMLSEAQFQALRNENWVLMDGRDVSGSKYAQITGETNLPDGRGVFLRGKNNGRVDGNQNPAGELDLGDFQNDAFQGHEHYIANTTNGNAAFDGNGSVNRSYTGSGVGDSEYRLFTTNAAPATAGITTIANGRTSTETRPKNITINYFIKIN